MKSILKLYLMALLPAAEIHAEVVTLYVTAANPEVVRSSTITLQSNEIAQVKYTSASGTGVSLFVNNGTATFSLSSGNNAIISGPASLYLETQNNGFGGTNAGVCTLSIARLGDQAVGNFVPSNAVVVPADSGGSVQIILESSVDLISWTAATPGTYGAQTAKRFFRVRAQMAGNP